MAHIRDLLEQLDRTPGPARVASEHDHDPTGFTTLDSTSAGVPLCNGHVVAVLSQEGHERRAFARAIAVRRSRHTPVLYCSYLAGASHLAALILAAVADVDPRATTRGWSQREPTAVEQTRLDIALANVRGSHLHITTPDAGDLSKSVRDFGATVLVVEDVPSHEAASIVAALAELASDLAISVVVTLGEEALHLSYPHVCSCFTLWSRGAASGDAILELHWSHLRPGEGAGQWPVRLLLSRETGRVADVADFDDRSHATWLTEYNMARRLGVTTRDVGEALDMLNLRSVPLEGLAVRASHGQPIYSTAVHRLVYWVVVELGLQPEGGAPPWRIPTPRPVQEQIPTDDYWAQVSRGEQQVVPPGGRPEATAPDTTVYVDDVPDGWVTAGTIARELAPQGNYSNQVGRLAKRLGLFDDRKMTVEVDTGREGAPQRRYSPAAVIRLRESWPDRRKYLATKVRDAAD